MGRKRLDDSMTENIRLRVSAEEKEYLAYAARTAGVSLSHFIRGAALNRGAFVTGERSRQPFVPFPINALLQK